MPALLNLNTFFVLLVILCASVIAVLVYTRRLNTRLNGAIKLINDLYTLNQTQASTLSELLDDTEHSDDKGSANGVDVALLDVIARSDELAKRVLALENETQLLQQEDPALKMYSRAHELVKQGASIEDIIEASQLPRAEVEVLVGLHRHKNSPS